MCGIYAAFRALPIEASSLEKEAVSVSEALHHRGPDAQGWQIWDQRHLLLHRRLSILGLGPAGNQPMSSDDARYWISYNGEIYNYLELAEAEGWTLQTGTDTELLLKLWQAYGSACLTRLDGFFAFVLVDLHAQKAWAVRDFSGVKPLYWVGDGHQLLSFCSEEGPLLRHLENPRVCERAVRSFLQRGESDVCPWWEGVQELAPGHCLEWSWTDTALAMGASTAWHISESPAIQIHHSQALEAHLSSALRRRLRSDVPIGFALSGGLDSALILGMARSILGPEAPLHAFSVNAEGKDGDESAWQRLVAQHNRVEWHSIPVSDLTAEDLLRYVQSTHRPAVAWNNLAHWALCRSVHQQGIAVLFNGQGADELFGGYPHYYRQALLREPLAMLQNLRKWPLSPLRLLLQALKSWFQESGVQSQSPGQMMRADFFGLRLGQLLKYEDRNGMAFSLESRNPFADDRELAQAALALGPELSARWWRGYSKGALREVAESYVPHALRFRVDKKGFTVPECEMTLQCLAAWKPALFSSVLDPWISQKTRKMHWEKFVKNPKNEKSARLLFRCASLSYFLTERPTLDPS